MTGLDANTIYFYVIGDLLVGRTLASYDFSFRTPPALGTRGPLRTSFAVYGDLGLAYSQQTRALLTKLAASNGFDWVIHNGDISYADNRIPTRNWPGVSPSIYMDFLDVFYGSISAYTRRVPLMLSPGNHEGPCKYGEYEARHAMMPYRGAKSNDMQYYSYTVGQTHVVALSGERGRFGSVESEEMRWFEMDLAAAAVARDRGEITFIITHVHLPHLPTGYCSSVQSWCCANGRVGTGKSLLWGDAEGIGDACVDRFMTPVSRYAEDLLVRYGVDVHITAHTHAYERTTPVYRYKAYGNGSETFPAGNDGSVFLNPKYPININHGNPGNIELQHGWLPRPEWSVGLRVSADGFWGNFGFLKITTVTGEEAGGRASLNMQYIASHDGSTLDTFTIYKDRSAVEALGSLE